MFDVHVMPADPDLLHSVLLDLHMLDRRLCFNRCVAGAGLTGATHAQGQVR
jgi:hypothetical protein